MSRHVVVLCTQAEVITLLCSIMHLFVFKIAQSPITAQIGSSFYIRIKLAVTFVSECLHVGVKLVQVASLTA